MIKIEIKDGKFTMHTEGTVGEFLAETVIIIHSLVEELAKEFGISYETAKCMFSDAFAELDEALEKQEETSIGFDLSALEKLRKDKKENE